MDSSAYQLLNNVPIPDDTSGKFSLIALSRWNDLFTFSPSESKLYIASLKSTNTDDKIQVKSIVNSGGEDVNRLIKAAKCIKFNKDGNLILIWGPTMMGCIELPRSYVIHGDFKVSRDISCSAEETDSLNVELVENVINSSNPIVKAQWHPFHSECIVMLFKEGPLVAVTVRHKEYKRITVELGSNRTFVSFTFGPSIDWMAVTVFVLGEDGSMAVLCPLLPPGSLVPSHIVPALRERSAAYPRVHEYDARAGAEDLFSVTSFYLSAAFGDASSDYVGPIDTLRVGGGFEGQNYSDPYKSNLQITKREEMIATMLWCPPMLQGDLKAKRADKRGTACDIAILPCATGEDGLKPMWSDAFVAPICAVSWSDGSTSVRVIAGKVVSFSLALFMIIVAGMNTLSTTQH